MDNVWGTPDAPLIIQRDPAAAASAAPSILEVVDIYNCTYMFFKGITFKIQPPGDGNVVHLASWCVTKSLQASQGFGVLEINTHRAT